MRKVVTRIFTAVSAVVLVGTLVLWWMTWERVDVWRWGRYGLTPQAAAARPPYGWTKPKASWYRGWNVTAHRGRVRVYRIAADCDEVPPRYNVNQFGPAAFTHHAEQPTGRVTMIAFTRGSWSTGAEPVLGFDYGRVTSVRPAVRLSEYAAVVPLWAVASVASVLPIRWFVRRWRARRVAARGRAGLCAGCGYDLRASRERCPECGRVIPAT